jgi:hypothetical protein
LLLKFDLAVQKTALSFFFFSFILFGDHSPSVGGSHLPDLTVITPVFYPNVEKPVFFVANRGHHADIGGISPGNNPVTKPS